MTILKEDFLAAVEKAVLAPPKSGTKWDSLEKLFADNGLRGNGAINNGSGADRTSRIRQLGTTKIHNGHTTRDTATHSVFVIGGGSLSAYNADPTGYLTEIRRSLQREHKKSESCLVMISSPGPIVKPVHLFKSTEAILPVAYEAWWPNLSTEVMFSPDASTAGGVKEPNQRSATIGTNLIFFGSPGTGKSTEVKSTVGENPMVRTQFHPEYSHTDFVGGYRPVVGRDLEDGAQIVGHDGSPVPRPISYFAFVPGPFVNAIELAYNSDKQVYLVIEEINRGDCAAIFGDVFQLLDRDDNGRSEFGITPKPEIAGYMRARNVGFDDNGDGKLYIPANLSILATMNTSDQSLFAMDSAFKRRWQWMGCNIDFDEIVSVTDGVRPYIDDGIAKWDWIDFAESLNRGIVREKLEDKRLGQWFIKPTRDGLIPWDVFLNKCLFYLWHDVYKEEQFSDASPFLTDSIQTFSDLQQVIRDNGLAAGLKEHVLKSVRSVS